MYKLKCSSTIGINKQKDRGIGKPSVIFIIKNINILNNYFIPYLESMKFITKKGNDFRDFKIICKAVYNGSHKIDEIKSLILKLSYTMNNFRLSTYSGPTELLSKDEINRLINARPTIKHLNDGRQIDIDTNTVVPYNVSCVYEITSSTGEVFIMESIKEVLKTVGVGYRTLKMNLDIEGHPAEFNGYIVKRIPVFYSNKISQ